MVTKQQMQWSPIGAHYLLQTRTATLNGDLSGYFEHWYRSKISNDHKMRLKNKKVATPRMLRSLIAQSALIFRKSLVMKFASGKSYLAIFIAIHLIRSSLSLKQVISDLWVIERFVSVYKSHRQTSISGNAPVL